MAIVKDCRYVSVPLKRINGREVLEPKKFNGDLKVFINESLVLISLILILKVFLFFKGAERLGFQGVYNNFLDNFNNMGYIPYYQNNNIGENMILLTLCRILMLFIYLFLLYVGLVWVLGLAFWIFSLFTNETLKLKDVFLMPFKRKNKIQKTKTLTKKGKK